MSERITTDNLMRLAGHLAKAGLDPNDAAAAAREHHRLLNEHPPAECAKAIIEMRTEGTETAGESLSAVDALLERNRAAAAGPNALRGR